MKFKKSLLIIFLIICLFSIASVSAADDTAMELKESNSIGDSNALSASMEEDINEDINAEAAKNALGSSQETARKGAPRRAFFMS